MMVGQAGSIGAPRGDSPLDSPRSRIGIAVRPICDCAVDAQLWAYIRLSDSERPSVALRNGWWPLWCGSQGRWTGVGAIYECGPRGSKCAHACCFYGSGCMLAVGVGEPNIRSVECALEERVALCRTWPEIVFPGSSERLPQGEWPPAKLQRLQVYTCYDHHIVRPDKIWPWAYQPVPSHQRMIPPYYTRIPLDDTQNYPQRPSSSSAMRKSHPAPTRHPTILCRSPTA